MVSRLTLLALGGILCGALSGCTTPTGQAVADWLAAPLARLRVAADSDRLVVPELRRARGLLAEAAAYPFGEVQRATPLLRRTLDRAVQVAERGRRLPGSVIALVDRHTTAMKRRTANLVAEDGLPRQILAPRRQANALRRVGRRLPAVLGLDRPILPGPGDPDRQTVAHPTGPQETWVQKILRRIRL